MGPNVLFIMNSIVVEDLVGCFLSFGFVIMPQYIYLSSELKICLLRSIIVNNPYLPFIWYSFYTFYITLIYRGRILVQRPGVVMNNRIEAFWRRINISCNEG